MAAQPYQRVTEPSKEQLDAIDYINQQHESLHNYLGLTVSASRERSIALTKLEEFAMWANKAITHG